MTYKISQQGEQEQRNQNLNHTEFISANEFMWLRGSG